MTAKAFYIYQLELNLVIRFEVIIANCSFILTVHAMRKWSRSSEAAATDRTGGGVKFEY